MIQRRFICEPQLLAPVAKIGRVDALTAHQQADLAGKGTGVGLSDDTALLCIALEAPLGPGTTSVLAWGAVTAGAASLVLRACCAAPAVTWVSSVEAINCTVALEECWLRMVTSLLTKL